MSNGSPHIVLAALDNGEHVQIGRTLPHREVAHNVWTRLDTETSGFYRDQYGDLKAGGPRKSHFIDGHAVKFYRVRQTPNEFGNVRTFPLSSLRYTNRPKATKENTSMIRKTTPSGVARPTTGKYKSYKAAATVAKGKNVEHGRGYRALKALDGTYGVIFRPKVASNKQRRNREVV